MASSTHSALCTGTGAGQPDTNGSASAHGSGSPTWLDNGSPSGAWQDNGAQQTQNANCSNKTLESLQATVVTIAELLRDASRTAQYQHYQAHGHGAIDPNQPNRDFNGTAGLPNSRQELDELNAKERKTFWEDVRDITPDTPLGGSTFLSQPRAKASGGCVEAAKGWWQQTLSWSLSRLLSARALHKSKADTIQIPQALPLVPLPGDLIYQIRQRVFHIKDPRFHFDRLQTVYDYITSLRVLLFMILYERQSIAPLFDDSGGFCEWINECISATTALFRLVNIKGWHYASAKGEEYLKSLGLSAHLWKGRSISDLDGIVQDWCLRITDSPPLIHPQCWQGNVYGYNTGQKADDELVLRRKDLLWSSLHERCGMDVVWTNNFNEHLLLNPVGNELKIFWDVSIFLTGRSQTYLNGNVPSARHRLQVRDERLDREDMQDVFEEVRRTYNLLFSPTPDAWQEFCKDAKPLQTQSDRHGFLVKTGPSNVGKQKVGSAAFRIDINEPQILALLAKHIDLEGFTDLAIKAYGADNFESDIPRSTEEQKYVTDQSTSRRRRRYIPSLSFLSFRRGKATKPVKRRPIPGPALLSLGIILQSLQLSTFDNRYQKLEHLTFDEFPLFSERLRKVQKISNKHDAPSFWYLLKDKRNRLTYYTFMFGISAAILTTVFSLGALAVSIAQTVGTFRALNGPSNKNM